MTDFSAENFITSITLPTDPNSMQHFCYYAIRSEEGFVIEADLSFTETQCCSNFQVNIMFSTTKLNEELIIFTKKYL